MENSKVAHDWAHQVKHSGNGSNFSYEGDTLYSYRTAIARIAKHPTKNETYALFTSRKYSVSTSIQQNMAISASPYPAIFMDELPAYAIFKKTDETHKKNVTVFERELISLINKSLRARDKERALLNIDEAINNINAYFEFFGIKKDKKILLLIDSAKDITSSVDLEELKRKHEILRDKELTAIIKKWRENKLPRLSDRNNKDYLRISIDGKFIETSQQVKIPTSEAKRFFHVITKLIKAGGCSNDCNAILMKIYQLKEATSEHIVVGCHKVLTDEYMAIAKQLKWKVN